MRFVNIYVNEIGKNNSETIIFLHGGGLSGWMWDKQVEAFANYHCIVPDLPEHGRSTNIKPFTIRGAAEILIDIIKDHAKNGKAHLVGISLGAQLVVQIMSMEPELVDHAFISGTLIRRMPHTESLLKLLDYAIKVYEPVKDKDFFIKANMRTYNMPKIFFEKFKESTNQIERDSLDRILRENMLFKLPHGLEKVEAPVLVMTGEKDYKIIKESASDLVKIFPNSRAAVALKVGHLWNLESPELFNKTLMAWLTEHELPKNCIIPF